MDKREAPKTLIEAIRYFSDEDTCLEFMVALRWPNGVECPHCQSRENSFISTRRIWKCKACRKQFSVKVGTIFEDSPLSLTKWIPAIWMVVNCKNGVSSYEMGRSLGVTQKTAWFMNHRIRLAMASRTFKKLSGEVEVDESFIGGRARFMHKDRRDIKIKGRGPVGKAAVMGLLERHGEDGHSTVTAKVVTSRKRQPLQAVVKDHVEPGSTVYTDELKSYYGLHDDYIHGVINHAEKYVDGSVHTNGMENFWSLLKRSIKGTYVSVEPFHLFRYLDEQTFRFNNRKANDLGRFLSAIGSIFGRRILYRQLIGETR